MIFVFWSWFPLGSLFGVVLGAQMEAKSMKKWFQKVIRKQVKQMIDFWSILGSHWGPFGARKGEIRGLKSDLCSSRVPGGVKGSILGGFLMILGAIL